MAKRSETNGNMSVEFSRSDFDKIRDVSQQLREAANPADDFDPDLNMRKIIALNAKVAKLRERHETAKRALKETPESEKAVKAKEALNVAMTELDDFLEEMGREYPLFRPEPAKP
jgi:DNA-directed RNA polymerase alpha subunit